MNYRLPQTLTVNGREEPIRWEYTAVLDAIAALNDGDLEDYEKVLAFLWIIYENFEHFHREDYAPAFEAAMNFVNNDLDEQKKDNIKMVDFEQDFRLIVSAINRVSGKEIRDEDDVHWWTFLSWFMEIGECTYSTVLSIRSKRAKGKKLEPWEKEFFEENKDIVLLHPKLTAEERRQLEEDERILKELLG